MSEMMDRRIHERYPTSLTAKVTALQRQELSCSGEVCDISKSGVCVKTSLELSRGDLIRLEMAESVLYGHVAYSTPDETLFRTGIEVYQVVLGGTDLSDILQTILRQEMPGTPGVEPAEVYLG